MKLSRISVSLLIASALACSGGGGSTGPTGNTGGNNGGNGGNNGGGQCPTGSVCMLSRSFSPTSITIAQGGTVTFSNGSGIAHTVTFDGTRPAGVDDVPLNDSGNFPRTFTGAGTFKFHCTQHAGMTGEVVVQ